jgi:hypothetical protein
MLLIYALLLFLASLGAIWLLGTLLGFALDTFPSAMPIVAPIDDLSSAQRPGISASEGRLQFAISVSTLAALAAFIGL